MAGTRELSCPQCGAQVALDLPLYVRAEDEGTRRSLLSGQLGIHSCSGCDFVGFAAIPLLWDDPEHDLLTMLIDEDRDTLLEEFEDLLEVCRADMGEEAFEQARRRPFQIVNSPIALCEMVAAEEVGHYCYRSTPGLTQADEFDAMPVIMAAKVLRQAGRLDEAYDMLRRLDRFPTSSPHFHQELGAYAFDVGDDEVARAALLEAKRLQSEFSHVYQQVIPSQGVITKTPEGINLKKLAQEAKRQYSAMRPELNLNPARRAELGGELMGALERAHAAVDSAELDFYLRSVEEKVERWLNDQQEADLVALAEAQREEARQACEARRPPFDLAPPGPPSTAEPEREPGDIAVIGGKVALQFGNERGAAQAFGVADEEGSAEGAFLHGLTLLKLEEFEAGISAWERAAERGSKDAIAALEELEKRSS